MQKIIWELNVVSLEDRRHLYTDTSLCSYPVEDENHVIYEYSTLLKIKSVKALLLFSIQSEIADINLPCFMLIEFVLMVSQGWVINKIFFITPPHHNCSVCPSIWKARELQTLHNLRKLFVQDLTTRVKKVSTRLSCNKCMQWLVTIDWCFIDTYYSLY